MLKKTQKSLIYDPLIFLFWREEKLFNNLSLLWIHSAFNCRTKLIDTKNFYYTITLSQNRGRAGGGEEVLFNLNLSFDQHPGL